MKRMVKNGNLIDVEPNGDLGIKGNAQVSGRLQVNSSIISTGKIRGGDISGTKFLLGTEEMPLVKANPAGDATDTLEKIKIGNVAYNVGGGGGGGSNDREITLTMPYPSNEDSYNKKLYLDNETWNKINNKHYEIIKIYYNDGKPLGVFTVLKFTRLQINVSKYTALINTTGGSSVSEWYGDYSQIYIALILNVGSDGSGNYLEIKPSSSVSIPNLQKEKFDALYKLADKPTQDGTYVLKATVSGGAVTYTWVAQ